MTCPNYLLKNERKWLFFVANATKLQVLQEKTRTVFVRVILAYLEGFEPPTVRSVAGSSIQLSHRYLYVLIIVHEKRVVNQNSAKKLGFFVGHGMGFSQA